MAELGGVEKKSEELGAACIGHARRSSATVPGGGIHLFNQHMFLSAAPCWPPCLLPSMEQRTKSTCALLAQGHALKMYS